MTVRVIQVGLGPWGLNWAQCMVPQVPSVETVAFVARRAESLANAQHALGLPAEDFFNSLESALAARQADAVLVLANLSSHIPLVRTALDAGKHVHVEKPFTAKVAEARALTEQADQRGVILMVNQNFRFFPAAIMAARLVRKQELGPLASVAIDLHRRPRFKTDEEQRSVYERVETLLMDMSIHQFDLMRMVLGSEPRDVYCRSWNPPWSLYRDPASAAVTVTFENDVVVNYRGTLVARGQETTTFSGDWRMDCRDGEIYWRCRGDRDVSLDGECVSLRRVDEAEEPLDLPHVTHFGRAAVLKAFAEAIETGKKPAYFSSGADNLRTLALMEAAVESAKRDRVIQIGSLL